jgi:hypothetical protein
VLPIISADVPSSLLSLELEGALADSIARLRSVRDTERQTGIHIHQKYFHLGDKFLSLEATCQCCVWQMPS